MLSVLTKRRKKFRSRGAKWMMSTISIQGRDVIRWHSSVEVEVADLTVISPVLE